MPSLHKAFSLIICQNKENKNPHQKNQAGNCYEQATDCKQGFKIRDIFSNKQVLVNEFFKKKFP
jgi:hypothetical protein